MRLGACARTVQRFMWSHAQLMSVHVAVLLFFAAVARGDTVRQLRQSDGTDLQAAFAGRDGAATTASGFTFFFGNEATAGGEVRVTNGTQANTELVEDLGAGAGSGVGTDASQYTHDWVVHNDTNLLFLAANIPGRAWTPHVADEAGLTDISTAALNAAAPDAANFVVAGTRVFFSALTATQGRELIAVDADGSDLTVLDVESGAGSSFPMGDTARALHHAALGVRVLFAATVGSDRELYISGGTPATTTIVQNINTGGSSSPDELFAADSMGLLFFSANDGTTGREPWCSDGTSLGTFRLVDINPSGNSDPAHFVDMDGRVYFSAYDGTQTSLWRSDGLYEGCTTEIVGGVTPTSIVVVESGVLAFVGETAAHGREVYFYDEHPLAAQTHVAYLGTSWRVTDIHAGASHALPALRNELHAEQEFVYFRATSDGASYTMWRTDGGAVLEQVEGGHAVRGIAGTEHVHHMYNDGRGHIFFATPSSMLKVIDVQSRVQRVSALNSDGLYTYPMVLSFAVTFSREVNVKSVPRLVLSFDTGLRLARYTEGSGSTVLTFTYALLSTRADVAAQLDYSSEGALLLPASGWIRDNAGNDVILTLPSPGGTGSLSDHAIEVNCARDDLLRGLFVRRGDPFSVTLKDPSPQYTWTLVSYDNAIITLDGVDASDGASEDTFTFSADAVGNTQLEFRYWPNQAQETMNLSYRTYYYTIEVGEAIVDRTQQ